MSLMKLDNPFPLGWWGFELEGYRPCDSTYCWFSFDSLPPLPYEHFQEDLNWLTSLEPQIDSIMKQYRLLEEEIILIENFKNLISSAHIEGITLPEPFVNFMGNLEFQKRVPSCTACYFEIRDQLMPCPVNQNNFVIRFLNDQQGVCTWYLYLMPGGEHCVIVSRSWFDLLALGDQDFTDENYVEAVQATYVCAQSFEEFLYRFWLENCIWFALNERHRHLTDAEESYLRHHKA